MIITAVVALAVVLAVGRVLVSRIRGQLLNPRKLYVLPAVLTGIGLLQLNGAAGQGIRNLDLTLIAVAVAVSAAMGVARGVTVAVYRRDGALWLRYRPATLALWAATLATRIAVAVVAGVAGESAATRGPAIVLSVGVTLLAEGIVVGRRASSPAAQDRGRWQSRSWRDHTATR